MSDSSEKWDAFDYLTVAGVALFLGGLGSALFRTLDVALSSCPPDSRVRRPRPTAPAEMALLQPGLITEGRIG
jgi:H+/Cl- antiporter ClcA